MKCDVCKKPVTKPQIILRWRSHWPDNRITAVTLLHKACDTTPWPSDGLGHIDVRALTGDYVAYLCRRADKAGEATMVKIQQAFMTWGYFGPDIASDWDDPKVTNDMRPVDDDILPF